MDKQEILAEIRRTAENGRALGQERFFRETKVRESSFWKFFDNWSQAVSQAGFEPNQKIEAIPEKELLGHLAALARKKKRFPTIRVVRGESSREPTFPAHTTFQRRLGKKATWVSKVAAYCREQGGWDDVLAFCQEPSRESEPDTEPRDEAVTQHGFVYLIQSGRTRRYKVGRTEVSVESRRRALRTGNPDRLTTIHEIKTDDAVGVEEYWLRRFEGRKVSEGGNEWHELSRADVTAFKRWKKIM